MVAQKKLPATQSHFRSIVTDDYLRVIGSEGTIFSMGDAATIEQASCVYIELGLTDRCLFSEAGVLCTVLYGPVLLLIIVTPFTIFLTACRLGKLQLNAYNSSTRLRPIAPINTTAGMDATYSPQSHCLLNGEICTGILSHDGLHHKFI